MATQQIINPLKRPSVPNAGAARPALQNRFLSAKQVKAALASGQLVGPYAAALGVVSDLRLRVPGHSPADLRDNSKAATQEHALIRSLAPESQHAWVFGTPGKDPYDLAIQVLAGSGNYKAAQQLIESRGKAIMEQLKSWAESERRNAELDAKASKKSVKAQRREKALRDKKYELAMHKVSAQVRHDVASIDMMEPPSGESSVDVEPRSGKLAPRSARTADKNNAAGSVFVAAARSSEPGAALDPPDENVGVHSGPRPRGANANYRINLKD